MPCRQGLLVWLAGLLVLSGFPPALHCRLVNLAATAISTLTRCHRTDLLEAVRPQLQILTSIARRQADDRQDKNLIAALKSLQLPT